MNHLVCCLLISGCYGSTVLAGSTETETLPVFEQTYPYFGDTHIHTALSIDAGLFNTIVRPVDSYRYAKGEEILSNSGQKTKIDRPLDFAIVTDHSDNLGLAPDFLIGAQEIREAKDGQELINFMEQGKTRRAKRKLIQKIRQERLSAGLNYSPGHPGFTRAWKEIVEAADTAYEPGKFTTFIGYEWSADVNRTNSIHRNVIYRDGATHALQKPPFTTAPPEGSDDPRHLYEWMDNYEKTTGGKVLAISHNANLSNGMMFPLIDPLTGDEIDRAYAEARSKFEPLNEISQHKGDSESHPLLSPNDAFADFGTWDFGNIALSERKTPDMLEFEYARPVLKNGLKVENKLGVNPFKFGFIGSTDTHLGFTSLEKDNFFGNRATMEPSPERLEKLQFRNNSADVSVSNSDVLSSGYAVIWAKENTREALFDAMLRKEVYATTGSRIIVRFFGGWSFNDNDLESSDLAAAGYSKGVPMGGKLKPFGNVGPTFLVAAQKDTKGANLDRIQIIKGWLAKDGNTYEKVYNVVWSDAETRKADISGNIPLVGDTTNISEASWDNSIGDVELRAVWQDLEFDPDAPSFYYARILEIPTPRWTAYDVVKYGLQPSKDVLMKAVQRAYTSPIWYNP